jgi:hypothetical protein
MTSRLTPLNLQTKTFLQSCRNVMNLTWWYYVKSNLKFITKETFTQLKQK